MTEELTRARALLDEQKFQEALEILRTCSPTPEVKASVARAMSGLGKFQQAHDLFSEALRDDPQNHEGYAGRGLIYYLSGHLQRAKSDYDSAIKVAPDNGRYRGLRGLLLGQVGDAPNALKDLESAYQLGDTNPSYILARAQMHLAARNLPKAKEALDLAERHDADQAALSSLEGAFSLMTGQPKEALASYRFAVEAAPQVPANWMNMLSLTAQIDRGRLLDEAKSALKALPDNEDIIQLAVGVHMENGKAKQAFGILKSAIERNPESPFLHFQMGMGLAHTEKFEKAVKAFTRALELEPMFPRALDARGNCLEKLGRKDEAQRDFEESARLRKEEAEKRMAAQGSPPTNGEG